MFNPNGIIGAPVTPFTVDNELDVPTLEKLINFLIDTGVDSLALNMHLAESLNMSSTERMRVVEIAVKTTGNRVPLLVHVSMPGTDQVIELARHSQDSGAAGVIVITPYYWESPPEALIEHFVAVSAAIDIGVIGYNFPEKLGITLGTDVISELISRQPNFIGLKDASSDMEYFTEVCRVSSSLRPDFAVLTGIENILLPSMILGGAGSFSACGAVAPRLVRSLYTACVNKDYETARQLQFRVSRLFEAIRVDYPSGIKVAMELMGRPVGPPRRPIPSISAEGRARLRKELEDSGILDSEPIGW